MTTKPKLLLLSALTLILAASCSPAAPIGDQLPQEATLANTQPPPGEATSPTASALTDAAPAATTTSTPATATVPDATPVPAATQPDLSGLPQVAQAKADLAQRLGVAPEDIQIIRAEAVTWPNAALGCPQPDMSYADVLVEGLLVELSHGGQVYSYHSGGTEPPFLCEQAGSLDQATPSDGSGLLTPPSPA